MKLIEALRLDALSPAQHVVSLVGAGGKSTALFNLAREVLSARVPRVLLTATSHLGVWQVPLADHHIIANDRHSLNALPPAGVILVTGEVESDRTKPVSETVLNRLHALSREISAPLLIEADGSRQKALKAPAAHEPPIPEFTDVVVHVAGLSAFGKALDETTVHRAEKFSEVSGLPMGEIITIESLVSYLIHPSGALKNIPQNAKRILLLNQADTPELLSACGRVANETLTAFASVIAGSLESGNLYRFERTGGVILAAGTSSRFGQPKQLLDWNGKPFVRHVTETALRSGLDPVVVVTGFHHTEIESHLHDLPVQTVFNADFSQGQASSIKAGVTALPRDVGSAIFLLSDQPQIPVEVIRALSESHTSEGQAILAPLVLEERRANPVLFDRNTFPDLMQLQGDMGGRGIFDKHKVSYLPWHDDILIFDVDTEEDYERLKRMTNE